METVQLLWDFLPVSKNYKASQLVWSVFAFLSLSVPSSVCAPLMDSCLEDWSSFGLSIPEIQWKFVHHKFLHDAEEGRVFTEDLFDGVWSFGQSTKTSFKLPLPKKEKEVGRRRRSKRELCWHCSSAEGTSGRLDFGFLWKIQVWWNRVSGLRICVLVLLLCLKVFHYNKYAVVINILCKRKLVFFLNPMESVWNR